MINSKILKGVRVHLNVTLTKTLNCSPKSTTSFHLSMRKQDQLTLSPSSPGRPGIPRSPWDKNTFLQTHYEMFRIGLDVVTLVAEEIGAPGYSHTQETFIILKKGRREAQLVSCRKVQKHGLPWYLVDLLAREAQVDPAQTETHKDIYFITDHLLCILLHICMHDHVSINSSVNDTKLYSDMGKMAAFQLHWAEHHAEIFCKQQRMPSWNTHAETC